MEWILVGQGLEIVCQFVLSLIVDETMAEAWP